MRIMRVTILSILVCIASWSTAQAAASSTIEDLRKEVADLRKKVGDNNAAPQAIVRTETILENKYGPGAEVTTRTGKLKIGGLLQIWEYSIQDDHQDVFGDKGQFAGSGGTGEAIDNNSYRVRRAELRFEMNINENVDAYVMIDPAREATSFPQWPSNQGLFKSMRENPSIATDGDFPISKTSVGRVQSGSGSANRLLQEAYINYHGVVPHHDFTIGQFKPPMGEEGTRSAAYLDFAERAMVTQINDFRDLGAQVHGSWWDDGRVQYWAGVFDGAGNYFGTAGQFQNRSDDNDEKDVAGRILVRPVWKRGVWGNLELGASSEFGVHGEAGDKTVDGSNPVNGLNRLQTDAFRHAAWMMYKPMGPVRGWWMRGEWGYVHDRTVPKSVNVFGLGSGDLGEQAAPNPFHRQGWYASTGYKLSDSIFADRLSHPGFFNKLLEPVEFAFRFESFENIITEDLVQPDSHTDVFSTNVFTSGVNYYIKDYNMRVQVNYSIVNEVDNNANPEVRGLREVKNNVFIFTYQVSF